MQQRITVTADRLRQEHAELLELERQLLKALAERRELPVRIRGLFERIHQLASAHLEDEIQGFLRSAAQRDPALVKECDELCGEHAQLKAQLDGLLQTTQLSEGSPEWWKLLETKCRDCLLRLDRHEFREQHLLDQIERVEGH